MAKMHSIAEKYHQAQKEPPVAILLGLLPSIALVLSFHDAGTIDTNDIPTTIQPSTPMKGWDKEESKISFPLTDARREPRLATLPETTIINRTQWAFEGTDAKMEVLMLEHPQKMSKGMASSTGGQLLLALGSLLHSKGYLTPISPSLRTNKPTVCKHVYTCA